MKHCCVECKSLAVWWYMPSGSDNRYFCDDHVSRGCSCNINPETDVEDVDEQGRLLPCCEYGYDPRGFWFDPGKENE